MRLSVSGQVYKVRDRFNAVLKWPDGAVSVCEIFQGIMLTVLPPEWQS
jgi:hypothetical protein